MDSKSFHNLIQQTLCHDFTRKADYITPKQLHFNVKQIISIKFYALQQQYVQVYQNTHACMLRTPIIYA